jgi:hypothetical protein
VNEQQKTLNAKLRGRYQYYGRPTNYRSLKQFYRKVLRIWRAWLSRRTRGRRMTWERFGELRRQPCLGGQNYLRNPLRQFCTVGSVRGSPASHGGLKRARSWKRRTQPKKTYSFAGTPLLGGPTIFSYTYQPALASRLIGCRRWRSLGTRPWANWSRDHSLKGLRMRMSSRLKSLSFLVTTTNWWTRAVAAIIASSSSPSGFRSIIRPHSRKHGVSIGSI